MPGSPSSTTQQGGEEMYSMGDYSGTGLYIMETGTVCSTYLTCHSKVAYLSFHLLHLECVSAMKLDNLTA